MEPDYVKIIHPETDNVAEVPRSSLPYHYRSGWAPLDESPEPEADPDPKPTRRGGKKAAGAATDNEQESE